MVDVAAIFQNGLHDCAVRGGTCSEEESCRVRALHSGVHVDAQVQQSRHKLEIMSDWLGQVLDQIIVARQSFLGIHENSGFAHDHRQVLLVFNVIPEQFVKRCDLLVIRQG